MREAAKGTLTIIPATLICRHSAFRTNRDRIGSVGKVAYLKFGLREMTEMTPALGARNLLLNCAGAQAGGPIAHCLRTVGFRLF